MTKENEKITVNGNLAYNYLMNYNYRVKARNFGVKWEDQEKFKTYKELVTELEGLADADKLAINEAAKKAYFKYLDILRDEVYPIIDKAINESGMNLVSND